MRQQPPLDALGQIIDLDRVPLHELASARGQEFVRVHKKLLAEAGTFSLPGFLKGAALSGLVSDLKVTFARRSFLHQRRHNIYFKEKVDGLLPDHGALALQHTRHRTICGDQLRHSVLMRVYQWPNLIEFIRQVTGRDTLYPLADPLAQLNVMSYRRGEGLGWHFDRSMFATTLLLQAPDEGGVFEYRPALRTAADANYEGIARLLSARDDGVCRLTLTPGTLNVFMGQNTGHRVTPVAGEGERLVAVFSYHEHPDVVFTDEERLAFYGRAE